MLLCCWISLQEDNSAHNFCCRVERMLTWELPSALSDKARPPRWHNRCWSWLQPFCLRGLAPPAAMEYVQYALTASPDMQPSTGVGLLGLAPAWITDSSISYGLPVRMAMIFCLHIMSLYFTMRIFRHWNRSSGEVVESLTLEVFKAQVNDSLKQHRPNSAFTALLQKVELDNGFKVFSTLSFPVSVFCVSLVILKLSWACNSFIAADGNICKTEVWLFM